MSRARVACVGIAIGKCVAHPTGIPETGSMLKLVVYVPVAHLEPVKAALFAAGAGTQGRYDRCCWQVRGEGQFRPLEGSRPFAGTPGHTELTVEYRVEMLCPEERRADVTAALRRAHPYEEPAFDFTRILDAQGL